MASAAAVATDISQSPLPYQENDDELGVTGTITSKDDIVPLPNLNNDEENHEDDILPTTRRRHVPFSANDNAQSDEDAQVAREMDDELFGEGSEAGQPEYVPGTGCSVVKPDRNLDNLGLSKMKPSTLVMTRIVTTATTWTKTTTWWRKNSIRKR